MLDICIILFVSFLCAVGLGIFSNFVYISKEKRGKDILYSSIFIVVLTLVISAFPTFVKINDINNHEIVTKDNANKTITIN